MSDSPLQLYSEHSRHFGEFKFVYPVLSRRSEGISLGINLNPDKICNFDCIYCQVDRRSDAETRFVETDRLLSELDAMFQYVASGKIFREEKFANVPPELRRLNDVAFSGDGEPTTFRNFSSIVADVAQAKRSHGLDDTKIVLITNASMFHRPAVKRALEILDQNNGEIWAKLDAGTADYYQTVERTPIPFTQILENITEAALVRPVVLQSLFMRIEGEPPPATEIEAFCDRINEIVAAGGQIKLVQVYTVARPPAESFVSSLSNAEVDYIAARVTEKTNVACNVYYGT